MSATLLVGVALLAATVPLARVGSRAASLSALGGSSLLVVVGLVAAGGWSDAGVGLGTWLGFGDASLRADGLAGIFLALTGVSGAAVSLAYFEHPPRRLVAALHGLLLVSMTWVIAADQAFVFLLGWELLTLTLYLLASADRDRPGTLAAGYFTGTMNKLGGGALLAAFGLLYAETGSFRFDDWSQAAPAMTGATRGIAFLLLLIGFGTKVGMIPFQGWLPVGHAAAPGASSATLSGIAINAGFYGLWRIVFDILKPTDLWWGELVLVVGGLSALVGILYAIAQEDIKRFLGFSTIEHSGIALIGFGVALVGEAAGEPKLAAAGLLAATLHVIAHAVAKTLAFLAADRVARAAGTRELAPLGGLARVVPRTAAGFGVATFTLAAIPPLGGFVSEWMTFEALLQGFRLDGTVPRLLMSLAAALLALTAGLALLAFAKLFGTVFLGRARSALAAVEPRDLGVGVGVLTLVALALGPAAPWEIRWLGRGLQDVLGFDLSDTAISHPLVLGPVFEKFSVLAPTWLSIVIPGYLVLTVVLVSVLLRPRTRRAPVWVSGTELTPPALVQYTPAAYSNPIRVVLRGPYGFVRRIRTPAPSGRPPTERQLVLESRVVPAFEHYLYSPLTTRAIRLSTFVRRLQSGRLGTYVLYMLVALIVVLALIPALHS